MLSAIKKSAFIILVVAAFALTACGGAAATAAPTAPAASAATTAPSTGASANVSFAKDIMPIFQTSCVSCHGGGRTSAGLDLKTYQALMAGSENGPVLTPGDAKNSLIDQLVTNGQMPKRGAKLTPDQAQMLTNWINAGAPNN